MNFYTTPFIRILLPFVAGIALAIWLDAPLPRQIWLLTILGFLLAALAEQKFKPGKRWSFGLVFQIFLMLVGYAAAFETNELRRSDHFSKIKNARCAVGTLDEPPVKGKRLRTILKIESAGPSPDSLEKCSGQLLVYLDHTPENESLRYGDRIFFRGKIAPVEPPKNPDAFDYRRYLHFQNVHFQSFVKPDSIWVLVRDGGNPAWRTAYRCRDRLLALLREHFPTDDEYAAAAALLLGHKEDLSDELRSAYAQTGSMHALAVSGTHVGVIFFGLLFALRRMPMPARWARWLEPGIACILIWCFTLLTGATASVVRAAVMFSIYLVGRAAYREASPWNVLCAAAFGQLFFNPFWLLDAGFQLSYSAVAGMVFFYPRFYRNAPVFKSKWQNWLLSSLLVGVAAQLGTLPLTLFYFHQFPNYFWLSGWVVIMGGAVFLYGCFFLALFAWMAPPAAFWLGKGLYWLVFGINRLILLIQKLPFGLVEGIWLTAWAVLLLYLALACFSAFAVLRRPRWLMAGLGILAFLTLARAVRVTGHFEQRKIVVYHVPRHSVLDFFDGEKRISLSDSVPEKPLRFAAAEHRIASRALGGEQFFLKKDTVFSSENLHWQPPFIGFFEKKFAVVDDPKWVKTSADPRRKIALDALILTGNPAVTMADCRRVFDFKTVVFDGSNSFGRVKKWKEECRTEGIKWHDTREQGAWVLEGK